MESTSDLDGVLEAVRNTAENASDVGFLPNIEDDAGLTPVSD